MDLQIPKLSKRTVIFCLLTLVLLSIAFRYPTTPHQNGVDGYFSNAMAKFIIEDGRANWILSPFSYMGLGPFSYPAAIHFLIACISQITHLSVEGSVFFLNIILGICGVLFPFIMVKELLKNNEIALLSSFFLSISPDFLWLTRWNGSSRSLVMIFFLLLFFLLMKTQYAKRSESHSMYIESIYTFLSILLLIMITTMHRMWIFAIFIIFGYTVSRPFYSVKKIITVRKGLWDKKKLSRISMLFFVLWCCAIIGLIYAQLTNMGIYSGMNLWFKYQEGFFFSGNNLMILLMNMMVDYWSGWGILSSFILLGAFFVFRKSKSYANLFLISSILLIAPIATLGLYTKLILLLFVAPLVAIGILWLLNWKHLKKASFAILLAILIVSCGFSVLMVSHWQAQTGGGHMRESQYDIALYVRYNLNENDTFITDTQMFGNKMISVADSQILMEGFPYPVVYGWIQKDDIAMLIDIKTMIEGFSIELTYPEEYAITLDSRFVQLNHVDNSIFVRSLYNVNYAVDSHGNSRSYKIEASLYDTRYLTFENSEGRVWYLG